MMDWLTSITWREPTWFVIALYPWLQWTVHGFLQRSHNTIYAELSLLPWARGHGMGRLQPQQLWRYVLLALAWLLFAMALAGPRLVETGYTPSQESSAEIVLVLDVSRSMSARDVAPDRLQRARLELDDLITRLQRIKTGLVVYAARPHLLLPPTEDKAVLRHGLQVVRHGLLPTEGSDLEAAIAFAAQQFSETATTRTLLLVTDGEIPQEQARAETRLEDMVTRLVQQGIALYALGMGSVEGAALASPTGWLEYQGQPVVSRLHEDRLRHLATLGNGTYARVADTDEEWEALYERKLRFLTTTDASQRDDSLIIWRELYVWCLLPATLLLLLAYLNPRPVSAAGLPLLLLLLFSPGSLLHAPPAQAADESWQPSAYQAYGNRDWAEARQLYARITGYIGRMGEGSSAYQLAQYRDAAQLFTQAVLDADNDADRAQALFNLANSHYRLEDYAAAQALYREVLRYEPDHHAAHNNLDFALAMLKRQTGDDEVADTARPGRGPRSISLAEGTDVADGALSLENADASGPATMGSEPPAPGLIQDLLHSRPASRQVAATKDTDWYYAATTTSQIVLKTQALKMDQSLLWQRLFEAEEGFPAPVATPRELPEIPPW